MGWTAFGNLPLTALRVASPSPWQERYQRTPSRTRFAVKCMTHSTSSSDSPESPKSISSYENKTSTHSQGSSRSRSTTVNAPRSVNFTSGALVAPAAPVRTDCRSSPRRRISRTPFPSTTSVAATPSRTQVRSGTPSESDMSTSQTLTSTNTATAAEGGWRFASLDSGGGYHRYSSAPHFPARLIVNATATLTNSGISTAAAAAAAAAGGDANVVSATSSGSALGSHGSMQDRRVYSYSHSQSQSQSQSYSQIGTSTSYADGACQTPQRRMEDRAAMSSHLSTQSTWSATTITEILADTDTDTDAAPAPAPAAAAAAAAPALLAESNLRSSQSTYGNIPASANSSSSSAGWSQNKHFPAEYDHVRDFTELPGSANNSADVYRPPSLSSYELTPAAARATVYAELSPPSHPASWNSREIRSLDTDRQQSTAQWAPSTSATSTTYSVSQSSGAVPESSSSARTDSPERPGPSSWVHGAPHTMPGSDGSVYPRYTMSHAIKVPQRPSLARSTLFSSSESSSSLQLASFEASGASSLSDPAPTSATVAQASSCVPEPANSFPVSQYGNQSPVSPPRLRENPPASVTAALSPLSTAGRQEQEYSSPYESGAHSPASTRLVRSDASPEREQVWHHQPTEAVQSPSQQHSGPFVHPAPGPGTEAGASPGSSSSVTVVDPSVTRGMRYTSAGPSLARESGSSTQSTAPVTITAARPYDYSYFNSFSASAPISTSGVATTSTAVTGSTSTSQSTRKRNHHCLMCDKSFDRPSTLRKHLLVHTGEKAHVCEICGRRFGVASNLNRHFRRCIARPVNSAAFRSTSSTSASAALQALPQDNSMAREQTNPDVRRAERVRDGREVPEDEEAQPSTVPSVPSATDSTVQAPRGRRRGRSPGPGQTPLSVNIPATSEAGTSSSQQASYHLHPALNLAGGSGQASGQVAVATASTSTGTGEGETERRPKRRRRAPSPSRWVPASLRNFSLSPVRTRTSTPLPPVSPGYDAATGTYEERDSYATVADENVDPSGENSDTVRTRAERLRNFEYAPYHPCGWTGRLPGPAVVGNDVTNYTKGIGGGSGHGGGYSGGNGGGLHFMFEFSLTAAG